jgi:DNA-binding MarR family transcriptional regulator
MSAAENTFLMVVRAAGGLLRGVELLLNQYGLTLAQYNVLRILRGAGENGACGSDIAGRLITAEPDITRLLDRLERRALLLRRRDAKDRRYVTARITPSGLETLAALDQPVEELHSRQLERLSGAELRQLTAVLEKLRGSEEGLFDTRRESARPRSAQPGSRKAQRPRKRDRLARRPQKGLNA